MTKGVFIFIFPYKKSNLYKNTILFKIGKFECLIPLHLSTKLFLLQHHI